MTVLGELSGLVNSRDLTEVGSKFSKIQKLGLIPNLYEDISDEKRTFLNSRANSFFESLVSEIKQRMHKNTNDETITQLARSLGVGSSKEMLNEMKENNYATETWKRQAKSWRQNGEDFKLIRDLVIASSMVELLASSDEYITEFARNGYYIAPLRATAERYYRLQNLAVDEVDFQGQNLAMFLRNLSEVEKKRFADWTRTNFGFIPRASLSGGHISLKLTEADSGEEFNLADMGFGFSQVLPILTQLWTLSSRPRRRFSVRQWQVPIIFAIEQPELHLHPRLPANLLDSFLSTIKIAQKSNIDLRLIIETHSETIVNRLGHRIANNDVAPEDINVVLFEKSQPGASTEVHFGKFDSQGFLINWPFGFFEPDEV